MLVLRLEDITAGPWHPLIQAPVSNRRAFEIAPQGVSGRLLARFRDPAMATDNVTQRVASGVDEITDFDHVNIRISPA